MEKRIAQVSCPTCSAPAGRFCSIDGHVHLARVDAYRALRPADRSAIIASLGLYR